MEVDGFRVFATIFASLAPYCNIPSTPLILVYGVSSTSMSVYKYASFETRISYCHNRFKNDFQNRFAPPWFDPSPPHRSCRCFVITYRLDINNVLVMQTNHVEVTGEPRQRVRNSVSLNRWPDN